MEIDRMQIAMCRKCAHAFITAHAFMTMWPGLARIGNCSGAICDASRMRARSHESHAWTRNTWEIYICHEGSV